MTDNINFTSVIETKNSNSSDKDAFGRQRVSNPHTVHEANFEYSVNEHDWNSATVSGGTITHLPNESSIQLQVGTTSGDKAIRQSKIYNRYLPGKSQQIYISGVMSVGKTNLKQKIGHFDDDNGLFFQLDGTELSVVRRTKTSGSVVDNTISQSNWNLDVLDGTGSSKETIDTSKANVYVIDFQWLGSGRVRFGFFFKGQIVYCHELNNENILSGVYMTTPHLPVRYEIENTGTTSSSSIIKQICDSIVSEGGLFQEGHIESVSLITTPKSIGTTRAPIISIRIKPTFGSKTNRGLLIPTEVSLLITGSTPLYYEIMHGNTLTGASWNSVNTKSMVQFDITATDVGTEGYVHIKKYAASGGKNVKENFNTEIGASLIDLQLSNSFDGTTPEIFSVVGTGIGGTATVYASIIWREIN